MMTTSVVRNLNAFIFSYSYIYVAITMSHGGYPFNLTHHSILVT